MEMVFLQGEPCNGADLSYFPSKPSLSFSSAAGKVPGFEMCILHSGSGKGKLFFPSSSVGLKDLWGSFSERQTLIWVSKICSGISALFCEV